MLRCNMKHYSQNLKLGLEDLLADLWHARRSGDLGRLALLSFYEVRRWARLAEEHGLAEYSSVLVTRSPYADRESFMADIERLIAELERLLNMHAHDVWPEPDTLPVMDKVSTPDRRGAGNEMRH